MEFAGKVWRLLVAIKDGLALLFLLLFFVVLFAALSARPGAARVHEGALLLRLDGAIVEEPAMIAPLQQLLSRDVPATEYRARDLVHALRTAARDKRIKTVVLDLSRFTGGGLVSLQDVAGAIDQVRAAGKPVLAHAVLYTDDSLLLAAHASEVWIDPMGGVLLFGPGGKQIYFAGLLERLKVTAHVFRAGTFKSAVEPYLLSAMSPQARENAQALYGALFAVWKADVARVRPKADLALVTHDPAGWIKASGGDGAKAALAAGLVDRIGGEAEFGRRVAAIAGEDSYEKRPGTYAHTGLRAWLAANPPAKAGKPIGIVTIAGEIVAGNAGPGTAGSQRIADLLDDAWNDDLAALVVRVDSPGGSIIASEQIRRAIARYREKGVPVVVSMANVAASGGYWVATPAKQLFAEPGTITGSIGVFAVMPSFERTLAGLGVNADGVSTTPITGQPDFLGGFSPEIAAMLQANIEHNYGMFLGLVGKARGKTAQQVDAMAQGRVWDGGSARQLGLVDRFGGLDDALAEAAQQAGLKPGGWHAVHLGGEADPLASLLVRLRPDEDADGAAPDMTGLVAERNAGLAERAVAGASRLLEARGAMAYCLECPPHPSRKPASRDADGTIALVARALGLN